ncbi:hypothetical protein MZE23_20900, partial [Escherichia coli]|nr:hypothetical protein [Escherichia coli]MCK2552932.1 hypothetical protein [Escherichia coli]MCK2566601.1 hypothetical protein [Escherichia coli]
EWVHVQLHQQKGMISLSPPTICNSAEQDDKGWDARKRAYCLKIQPATGSFARNLIYSTKPELPATLENQTPKPLAGLRSFSNYLLYD